MKASELRDLSLDELRHKLEELTQEVFNLRFQNATDQLENRMRLGETRRDIARVMTILREREIAPGSES
jgi:large subunit ribosomal protein L29